MVLRQHAFLLVAVAVVLVTLPAPALSRPTSEELKSGAEAAAPVGLITAEQQDNLEKAVVKSDVGPAKKPTKRSQAAAASISQSVSVLAPPPSTAESVSLSPQIPDPDKKGSAIQGLLLNILHPKPIVDTIREEDKYGNTGDKLAFIGRGVVAGAEGFSQVLLKVLDFPFDAVKKVSRSATEALNNLGSKLIGLS